MPVEATEVEQVETPATTTEESAVATVDEGSTPASAVEKPQVDTAKLHASVEALLGKAFDKDQPADEEQPTEEEEAAEVAAKPGEEKPADEEEVVEEEGKEAEEAAAQVKVVKPDANAPTLPAHLTRTLKAYGWSDEDIASNHKTLGQKFVETAQRLHNNRNDEVSKWAQAGREAKAAQQQQQQQRQQQQPQEQPATLAKLDVAALKKEFGDDKLIDVLVGPVNSVIDRINAVLPVVQTVQKKSETAETESLIRSIDSFFGSKELEPFRKDVYGDNGNFAGDKKFVESRNKVLEMADALISGAGLQGRSLTLGDALTMAHDALSSGYKVQAVRTTIKKQLVQRNKGISLVPQNRGNNPAGHNGTKKAVEAKVGGFLAKAFSRQA